MQLFINRESPVPLQDQLSAQIGQLVAAGHLAAGTRLPSTRALAGRLGLHPHTILAAYKTLAARGVVVSQAGSGVRVADFGPGGLREGLAMRALAARFVAEARARGQSEAMIRAAVEAALSPAPASRLVIVNPHPDLQVLYMRELGEQVDIPMEGQTPEAIAAAGPDAWADAVLLTSMNFATPLKATLGDTADPIIFKLASAEPLLARIRALEGQALVALLGDSPRFRFLTRELLAGLLGPDRLVDAEPGTPEADSSSRLAGLIVADAVNAESLRAATRTPVYTHRLLADEVFDSLAERLPPEVFRPRGEKE